MSSNKNIDFTKIVFVVEFLINKFEKEHPLSELANIEVLSPELAKVFPKTKDKDVSPEDLEAAITLLSPEDKKRYELRTKAKEDLIPITKLLAFLLLETNISAEEYNRLNISYLKLSSSVGMVNNGKVRHN